MQKKALIMGKMWILVKYVDLHQVPHPVKGGPDIDFD